MNHKNLVVPALFAAFGLAAGFGAAVMAESSDSASASDQSAMQLPPGWSEADMQSVIAAATPGEMHKRLAQEAGVWQGKTTMWMTPDSDPVESPCKSVLTPIMDGRYTKCEMSGEMPGMGTYSGVGIYGYDKVSEQFVSVWLDNQSTGIMNGVGELSEDGKTIAWKYTYNCPLTGKGCQMREIETNHGPNSKTIEMYGPNPKTGKEYKLMVIQLTRIGA